MLLADATGLWHGLAYGAAALAGLVASVPVNALADRVEGVDEPLWQAETCRKCGARLPRSRLIPVVSLPANRRACPKCGTPASSRRPLLGLALAVALPLLLARIADPGRVTHLPLPAIFAIDAVACCVLAFIFAVDLEHRLILDAAVYPASAGLLLVALFFDHKAFAAMLFGVVVFGGLFLLLYGLGLLLYRTEALGLGDVKLAVLLGLLVGWPAVATAVGLAALLGFGGSLLLLGTGTAGRRTYIPYGIFMVAGAVLALLLASPYW
ncbi:MAG TPA: prepilin peptidase [Ktedonobacterales bacterium]|nr:prepilin peptidase [Ktedonobacterales bacterium]